MQETESITDLPPSVRQESSRASVYARRGRFLAPTNSFRDKLPPVPAVTFTAERDRAFDRDTPSGAIALDIADRLASPVPATTPLLLARYLRVRTGEALRMHLRATAGFYYVIRGAGESTNRTDRLAWSQGDIFRIPGGSETIHRADHDAVLWAVSNEPEVAFHRLEPPATDLESLAVVHFPAADIRQHLDDVRAMPNQKDASGKVVVFATADFEKMLSLTPSMTLALNSMELGQAQRGHRHNSAAVTLVIEGQRCYSVIDGKLLLGDRWQSGGLAALRDHDYAGNGRPLSPQRGRPARDFPHRTGWRAVLSLPCHWLLVRVMVIDAPTTGMTVSSCPELAQR